MNKLLETLSDIKSFPEVESIIREIIANHIFSNEHLASMRIKPVDTETELITEDRSPFRLPYIDVWFLSKSKFKVGIWFESRPWGDLIAGRMYRSKFLDYFMPNPHSGWYLPEIVFESDFSTLARFVTYHMQILGYESSSDFKLLKTYDITNGDMSLAKISDDIRVPPAVRRAMDTFMQLNVPDEESTFLTIFSKPLSSKSNSVTVQINHIENKIEFWTDWNIDEPYLEQVRNYHNFDCIRYTYCHGELMEFMYLNNTEEGLRFLTDFFLFLNPDINPDSISAELDFSYFAIYEEDSDQDWSCEFCSEEAEPAPERLQRIADLIESYRVGKAREDEDDIMQSVNQQRQADCPVDNKVAQPYPSPENAIRFLDTKPLETVVNNLERIELSNSTVYPGKVNVYNSGILCMAFNVCRYPYFINNKDEGRFVLSLYLTPEQEHIFNDVHLAEETHTFTMDDGVRIISLTLDTNPHNAAKHITYYINALGYDPAELSFEIVKSLTTDE